MQRPSPSTRVPRVRRLSIALVALAAGLALLVPSTASAASFGARGRLPQQQPGAGQRWNITIDAGRASQLSGSTKYQFLLRRRGRR